MTTIELVKELYKNDKGEPFELTLSQGEIFDAIFGKLYPRLFITAWTQFGKSDVASMAMLSRICGYSERFAIVAPTNRKAGIIMGYLIDHTFDNPITLNKFSIGENESLERIRRERNKSHLTFKHSKGLGEVMTLSAEGRRTKDVINQLLGFGAPNVLIDESPLLSLEHYAGILRMLGGHKENMLVEIGNAVYRNHFYKASRDSMYHKIIVPYEKGIEEGRQTKGYFDEMERKMPPQLFNSLYKCQFPDETAIDSKGYSPLLTETELDKAYVNDIQIWGDLKLGCDVAGGGKNYSVIVLRGTNGAKLLYRQQNPDTMSFTGIILRFAEKYKVEGHNIFVDVVGIGKGVYDRLIEHEDYKNVQGVNVGNSADEEYLNKRAQAFWQMTEWLRSGGQLKRHSAWEELLSLRYKVQSDKKIKIKPKEEMFEEGIASPDVADALMLTFCGSAKSGI